MIYLNHGATFILDDLVFSTCAEENFEAGFFGFSDPVLSWALLYLDKSNVFHFNLKAIENWVKAAEQLHQCWERERRGLLALSQAAFLQSQPLLLTLARPKLTCLPSHHLLKPLWAEQLLHPAHSHALLHPWIDSLDEEPVLLLPLCLSPSKESPSSSSSGKGGREGGGGGQKLSSHKSRTEDVSPSHITVTYTSPPRGEEQWKSSENSDRANLIGGWGSWGRASSALSWGLASSWPTAGSKVTLPTPTAAHLHNVHNVPNVHSIGAHTHSALSQCT